MSENVALKLSMNDKLKHNDHKHDNRHFKKNMHILLAIVVVEKGHIIFYYSFKKNVYSIKKVWVPKGSHMLTNHQGPVKLWVPKSST